MKTEGGSRMPKPGVGGGADSDSCGSTESFCAGENVPELDTGDGCTIT